MEASVMTFNEEVTHPIDQSTPAEIIEESFSNSERRRSSLDTAGKHGKRSSAQTQRSGGSGIIPPAAPTRLKVYKSNSRSKWVNREIAALEFLLGIPLEAEQAIVRKGWMQQQGIVEDPSKQTEEDEAKAAAEVLEPPIPHQFSSVNPQIGSHSHQGRWWEKWIANNARVSGELMSRRSRAEDEELELPHEIRTSRGTFANNMDATMTAGNPHDAQPVVVHVVHAPGRRLQGDEATKIQIPIPDEATTVITRKKNIARMSFMREWEIRVAHGIGDVSKTNLIKAPAPSHIQVRPPLLDGRLFFSADESYPIGVFSLLRYEPKKEEAARRRQKLEARGGGGTQFFIMPVRDWRGISYRALLPPRSSHRRIKSSSSLLRFDRFASSSTSDNMERRAKNPTHEKLLGRSSEEGNLDDNDEDNLSTDSEEEDDTYVVGLLDDPEMVQGRHRNVMFGDRVTGPIVSSTIQFVKPALLKADLNKQFRERFDGWEPPKSQRKYIGARVVDGIYTLMDPGQGGDDTKVALNQDDSNHQAVATGTGGSSMGTPMPSRKRMNSVSSISTGGGGGGDSKETIRMPPSLTLSKIRSIKQQTLLAALQAKLEISTVALSIVYFERLCLDCRVDKTNRRLSFAACLLLALKMNEAHVELVTTSREAVDSKTSATSRIQSLIRPAKKSGNVLASLLEFFTQEWNLSLKHLFAAEWGVFAALQFRLHAKPSQVAFHFRRLLKAMDWNPRAYLGPQMYAYWMDALSEEEYQRVKREERRKERNRKKIVHLQRELQAANRVESGNIARMDLHDDEHDEKDPLGPRKEERGVERNGSVTLDHISPLASPRKSRQHSRGGLGRILTHFAGGKRALSSDKLALTEKPEEDHGMFSRLPLSPSMPSFPTESDLTGSTSSGIKLPFGGASEFTNILSADKPSNDDDDDDDDGWVFP